MAKLGAAEHEIDKAVVKEAKLLKAKARKVARWIGMAAAASFGKGVAPSRQPKEEWPARTPEQRGILSRERTREEPAEAVEPPRAPTRKFAVASVRVAGAARIGWVERAAKRLCARGPKGVADYVRTPGGEQGL